MDAGARGAARILDATSPDHLVVVGIAGGIGASVAVGDLVVPDLVVNLDSGERFRPNGLGHRPSRGTLASSDALLSSATAARRLEARGVVAIDMETAAIAAVCERRGCPWSVFRAISDRADDETTDAAVLGLVHPDGRPNLPALARFVLRRPQRIPQLVRLGRGASAATRAAATAAIAALAAP
jgi:nucleoside phosphorylase